MRQPDVLEHARRQPFEPFRIVLSDGRTYDICHPDLCIAGRSALYVGVAEPTTGGDAERVDQVSLLHVVRIEPLDGNKRRSHPRKPKEES